MSLLNQKSQANAKAGARIGIAVSSYNEDITSRLLKSCIKELNLRGVAENNIDVITVPGVFELPYTCKKLAGSGMYDAVIAIGCIVKGETPHFDFIAFAVANGIMELNLQKIPVIFGVLTVNNIAQAKDRIKGGKRGDKGVEAAIAAIEMINLNK